MDDGGQRGRRLDGCGGVRDLGDRGAGGGHVCRRDTVRLPRRTREWYAVHIDGAEDLLGQVWNTGHWASLSPWLPLGRLRIPAGRSTVAVRAIDKVADGVMALHGVRLVPASYTS
jgi:hypothetical protein